MAKINNNEVLEKLLKENFDLSKVGFNHDEITIKIKALDKTLCIDSTIANVIILYQENIYTTFSLAKYGTTDTRKIPLDEKDKLSLNFSIKSGCTEYEAIIKEVLKMFELLPSETRIWGLGIISVSLLAGWGSWLYYKIKKTEKEQLPILEALKVNEKAIEKLSDISKNNYLAQKAIDYATKTDKTIITTLAKSKQNFEIDDKKYTNSDIEFLQKKYSERTSPDEVVQNISGKFLIKSITTNQPYYMDLTYINDHYRAAFDPALIGQKAYDYIIQKMQNKEFITLEMELNVVKRGDKIESSIIRIITPQHNSDSKN